MNNKLHKIKREIFFVKKYGVNSFRRQIQNYRFHQKSKTIDLNEIHLLENSELEKQRSRKFSKNVRFSILTPLFNTPEQYLNDLIESLEKQTYENWELCLSDGSDADHQYVGEICKNKAKNDNRIKYKVLTENKGISENTNECIKLATGDYYGLVDHDDYLHPAALFEVMKTIEEKNADFIYTDEVKFSGNIENINSVLSFNLKPGFGKYDLRSHNYICHFTVFDKHLLEDEESFYRMKYDGSQDHDMVLRMTEKAKTIIHIPKVLYYWRLHNNSVSMNLGSKQYAVDAAIHAVAAQLERNCEKGIVESAPPFQTLYRIKYDIEGQPMVSIVLNDWYEENELNLFINTIVQKTHYRPLEIVFPGGRTIKKGILQDVEFRSVYIDKNKKRNELWNKLIEKTHGEHIVLMGGGSIPKNDKWIEEMLMLSQKKDVCAVGPKMLYPDNAVAYGGGVIMNKEKSKLRIIGAHDNDNSMGYEAMLCHVRNTTFTVSECMMVSKNVWDELQGFNSLSGYEDVDFCLRGIKKGYSNLWTCFAKIQVNRKHILPRVSKSEINAFSEAHSEHFEEAYFHYYWDSLGLV